MNPWDIFKDGIFWVISNIYQFVGDWGLAIIIVTLIFRGLLLPLMHKQSKSSYAMKKFAPEINRIKELYANDQMRQSQEIQKVYAEAKFNPISGCLPVFIQMPIFIALFQVLREIADRGTEGMEYKFFNLVPDLLMTPNEAWEIGFLNALPYLILMIIFAGCTFLPMILQQKSGDEKQRKQTILMSGVMSVMMLFFGWQSPAGVLLFWGSSSIIALIQTRVSMRMFEKNDKKQEEDKEYQPVKVDVVRKEKNKRPRKKK